MPRARAGRRAALLALLGIPLLAWGCGGGGGGDTNGGDTTPSGGGPVVRVVDGDTGQPLVGATIRAFSGPGRPTTLTAGSGGRATLPEGTILVRARASDHGPGRASVKGPETVVELYDPRLQSPQYGGGPDRLRYVPDVRVGPPEHPPAWTFQSRTLLEFPPAVENGVAVVGTNSGRVYALDVHTGKVIWAKRQRGYIAATPAIAYGRVYVAAMDGTLTCYRMADGLRIWQASTGGSPIESSPLVVADQLYFGAWNGKLYSYDLRTGKLRWTFQAAGDIKGSAAQAGNLVVVGDYAGRVHGVSRATGRAVWTYTGGRRFYGGPGVSGGALVIGDVGGSIISLDAQTGRERWRVPTGGAYVYSSPAIANGVAYIGSYDGRLRALEVSNGASRWTFDVGGRISGSATVVDGIVYTARLYAAGQPRATYGLDAGSGAIRFRGPDGRYSPAVGAGRTLYLVGTRRLYAYRSTSP